MLHIQEKVILPLIQPVDPSNKVDTVRFTKERYNGATREKLTARPQQQK